MIHERQSRLNVGTEGKGDKDGPNISAKGGREHWFLRWENQAKEQFARWSAELGLHFGCVLLEFGLARSWSVGAGQESLG